MPVYALNFTYEDTEGDSASVGAYVNVADEATAQSEFNILGQYISIITGCRLSSGNISRPVSETALGIIRTAANLQGGTRPLAGAQHDASHGMRFLFTHTEGDTKYTIPGFRDSLMSVNAKTADLANADVDNLVDYLVGGTVVDYRGATVVLLNETYETWAGKPA